MKTMVLRNNRWRVPSTVILKALLVWVIGTGVYMNLATDAAAEEDSVEKGLTFDHMGYIDRVGDGELVIDDRLVKFSASTQYYSRTKGKADRTRFREGMKVRYSINEKKEIMAIGLVED